MFHIQMQLASFMDLTMVAFSLKATFFPLSHFPFISGFSILGMLIGLQYLEVEAASQNKKRN